VNKKQKREQAAAKRAEFEAAEAERNARLLEQSRIKRAAEKEHEALEEKRRNSEEYKAKAKEKRERQARKKADADKLAQARAFAQAVIVGTRSDDPHMSDREVDG